MKNDLLKIVQHYEISNQQRKFVEECYELIEAILKEENKKCFKNTRFNEEHITEEIADVMVMLKQIQYYYAIEDNQIEEIMQYKIDRQLERIKNERD